MSRPCLEPQIQNTLPVHAVMTVPVEANSSFTMDDGMPAADQPDQGSAVWGSADGLRTVRPPGVSELVVSTTKNS